MVKRRSTQPTGRGSQPRTSRIDFHKGNTLVRVSDTYPSLPLTLIEGVQNSIDGEAKTVFVGVDLKQRRAVIADDGVGVGPDMFEMALAQVGMSIKDKDKLGRFGLGLISPLNKCANFTFTSVSMERVKPFRWTFKRNDIEQMQHDIEIPRELLSKMPNVPRPFADLADQLGANWRTMVCMNGIKQDRVTTAVDLEDLEDQIRSKLGRAMHIKGVQVRIALFDGTSEHIVYRDIIPESYTGEPLGVFESQWPQAGRVIFELYRAPKRGNKSRGLVSVAELDGLTAITWQDFMVQARGFQMSGFKVSDLSEGFRALGSGYFEGIIRCENVTLAPERTKFVASDALEELYFAIADWYEREGSRHYDQDRQLAQQERHQQLGMKSLEKLQELLHKPEFALLREALRNSVEMGRLGHGHLDPQSGRPGAIEDDPSTRVGQGGAGKERKSRGGTSPTPVPPEERTKDRPGDTPLGSKGPRGSRRQLVKKDSTGLWLSHEPFEFSQHLWEFDRTQGILSFNIIHPLWQRLDDPDNPRRGAKNDRQVLHLQDWIIVNVLSLLTLPAELFDQAREHVDRQAKAYIELFILTKR